MQGLSTESSIQYQHAPQLAERSGLPLGETVAIKFTVKSAGIDIYSHFQIQTISN